MFKIDDKVKIREDLEEHKVYGEFKINKSMEKLKGKTATIVYAAKDEWGLTYFNLDIDNEEWWWTAEMLEPIQEEFTEDDFNDVIEDMAAEESPINPNHYNGEIQPIEFMRGSFAKEEFKGFLKGNIIKYLSRYDKKNGVEDLKKAEKYLEWLMQEEN